VTEREDHRDYVVNVQYKTDANLAARQSIYRFQEPRINLHEHVLALAGPDGDETVLEIGCGNGAYLATLARLGHAGPVVGFDLSPGMLEAARPIAGSARLGIADAENLPVATTSVDVALAMHMLYHVPDRALAIRELRRVTKPDGVVLVVTNSDNHMRELNDVVLAAAGRPLPSSRLLFKMETGASELRAAFENVEACEFPSELHITDPQAAVDYVESMKHFVSTSGNKKVIDDIRARVEAVIARDGMFRVRTRPGCFVCR
jgi:ubiquinone/menaquinone biosynthesis C-methylase UbiE